MRQASAQHQNGWVHCRRIAVFLALYGFIFWTVSFLANFNIVRVPNWLELAPIDLNCIAVDNAGRLFCSSQWYSRIQVYDRQGHFLRGWYSGSPGGHFAMGLTQDEHVRVMAPRVHKEFVYTVDGVLLSIKRIPRRHVRERVIEYTDSRGDRYKARNTLVYPRVVKLTPSGEQRTMMATPLVSWLISPVAAFLAAAIGIIMGNVAYRKTRMAAPNT